MTRNLVLFFAAIGLGITCSVVGAVYGQETFRVSYGGYNETAAPMWLGSIAACSTSMASMRR
jgi:hypothetical protein